MTVYVDDYQLPVTVQGIKGPWSHLMADTEAELQTFARQIGLHRPEAYRTTATMPRYDVTDTERRTAIAAGAMEITVDQARALVIARQRVDAEIIQVAEDALNGSAPGDPDGTNSCRPLQATA